MYVKSLVNDFSEKNSEEGVVQPGIQSTIQDWSHWLKLPSPIKKTHTSFEFATPQEASPDVKHCLAQQSLEKIYD